MAARGGAGPRLPLPALLLLLLAAGGAGARWAGRGTSPHLQSIFLGRCAEYRELLRPQLR